MMPARGPQLVWFLQAGPQLCRGREGTLHTPPGGIKDLEFLISRARKQATSIEYSASALVDMEVACFRADWWGSKERILKLTHLEAGS